MEFLCTFFPLVLFLLLKTCDNSTHSVELWPLCVGYISGPDRSVVMFRCLRRISDLLSSDCYRIVSFCFRFSFVIFGLDIRRRSHTPSSNCACSELWNLVANQVQVAHILFFLHSFSHCSVVNDSDFPVNQHVKWQIFMFALANMRNMYISLLVVIESVKKACLVWSVKLIRWDPSRRISRIQVICKRSFACARRNIFHVGQYRQFNLQFS